MTATWLTGPALDVARTLPDASVDLVATSPPFLALRDYNGVTGQWGSEPTPAAFLDNLLALANELRRVLTPTGSLVVELGDTYSGSGGAGGDYLPGGLRAGQVGFDGSAAAAREANAAHWRAKQANREAWPLAKSMCLTPTLFPACLAYGRNLLDPDAQPFEPWRVRNVIVWERNNPPVGALGDKFRPAVSYITVACPSAKRWFDLDAVRGPGSPNTHARTPKGVRRQPKAGKAIDEGRGGNWASLDEIDDTGGGAPPLDHWHDEYDGDLAWLVNTAGSSLAHYAMWPARLAERLILAMCPAEVCRTCGEPRRRITSDRERFTSVQPDLAAHIRECRERSGLTSDDLNQRLGYKEIAKNWERTDRHGAAIPSPADWLKLKELIGVSGDYDHVVMGDRRWHQEHAEYVQNGTTVAPRARVEGDYMGSGSHGKKDGATTRRTLDKGWSDCGHNNCRPGHVLDPFAGTGTTVHAAEVHGRDGTGIDLDPANLELIAARRREVRRALLEEQPAPDMPGQGVLDLVLP